MQIIIGLQKKYWETYNWEHEYKQGKLSPESLHKKLLDTSSDMMIRQTFPDFYDIFFAHINQKRATFSPDFTRSQLNNFFDELNDLNSLQETIDILIKISR